METLALKSDDMDIGEDVRDGEEDGVELLCQYQQTPSGIFVPSHPPQLLPHIQFVPLLSPSLNLPPFNLKNRTRTPLRLLSTRLDPVMRLPAMTALGGVPQQHMSVFGEDDVVRLDVEVGDGGHDVGVRIGVVLWGVAGWECSGRGEGGVGVAEMGDCGAAFIFRGGIG